jgi:uncharacterized membrane protein
VNLAHLHLLLNHVPTVGFTIGIALFGLSLVRRNEDLRRASFVVFFGVALIGMPAYLSGDAANFILQRAADVSADLVAAHRNAALLALIAMEITGFVAWLALWRARRWTTPALMVLSIVSFVLVARAATIGGQIRHPEILAAGARAYAPAWPDPAVMGASLVLDNPWVWPICEVFHFVGLCLLFGVVLLVNLRLLGLIDGAPLADVNRLLPWAMAGLGVNIVTGMLFFLASPDQYTQNPAFVWKIGLVLAGALSLLYPAICEERPPTGDVLYAATTRRIIAACSIGIWIGVIFLGRYLPYLGAE